MLTDRFRTTILLLADAARIRGLAGQGGAATMVSIDRAVAALVALLVGLDLATALFILTALASDEILAPGDRLLIRQGDAVSANGTVASDLTFLDTFALTRWSLLAGRSVVAVAKPEAWVPVAPVAPCHAGELGAAL